MFKYENLMWFAQLATSIKHILLNNKWFVKLNAYSTNIYDSNKICDIWIYLLISWLVVNVIITYLEIMTIYPMVAGVSMLLPGEECVWNWSRSIRSGLHSIWYTHDTVRIHTRAAQCKNMCNNISVLSFLYYRGKEQKKHGELYL